MKFFILYVAFFFFLHQSEANASVVNASYDIDAAVNASDVNASATNATESKASDVNASAINAFADDPSGVNASDVNAAAANTSAGMDVKSSSFSRFESSMTLEQVVHFFSCFGFLSIIYYRIGMEIRRICSPKDEDDDIKEMIGENGEQDKI